MDLRNRVHVQAPAAWYARFVADMELYFQGCLTESRNRASGYTPEFEEYRTIRRASVGTYLSNKLRIPTAKEVITERS